MNLRKGDTVEILGGKDRGRRGKVLAVFGKTERATVEGLNIFTRHQKPKKSGQKGQKIQGSMPLRLPNLMLVCPHCGKPTRVGHLVDEKGIKSRKCKKCGKRI
jgi:large subunit ribosomal protein L24